MPFSLSNALAMPAPTKNSLSGYNSSFPNFPLLVAAVELVF